MQSSSSGLLRKQLLRAAPALQLSVHRCPACLSWGAAACSKLGSGGLPWVRLTSRQLAAECRSSKRDWHWLDEDHLAPVQSWLQAGSNFQQLAAAGYAPQSVLQHLEQFKKALQVFRRTCATLKTLGIPIGIPILFEPTCIAFVRELQSTGLALCLFAVPFVCNNPECLNMSGPSEQRLVIGSSCKCGGCRVARFCCRPCLRAHWKQHKTVCAALAAAAGAAAEAQ